MRANEFVIERKNYKRKSRYAAYGPGPYGGYGYYAGYSGDSGEGDGGGESIENESLDQPYPIKWEPSDYGDVDAVARMSDGKYLSIMFNKGFSQDTKEEAWSVEFFRDNSQEKTGEGDQQRVFATVLNAIQTFVSDRVPGRKNKYKPNKVYFSASKEVEPDEDQKKALTRASLYDTLVQRYARAWGFRAFRADTGNKVMYELTRIKPIVAKPVAENFAIRHSGYSGDSGEGGDGGGESSLEEGVNDPHIFKCIFLFGPMGAGKSTVANPLLTDTGLRSVNLDNFNELFIKKGQVPTGHLSPDQLEKSWQLTQKQQQNFIDGRLGVIIDGSGRNPNTAIGVIEKLQPLGYEFMMIFVNVSEATSIARQQSRADKQQKQWGVGRQIDPTLAKDTYTQVQKNLSKYSTYFGPQRFVYVDNENTPDLTQVTKKVEAFLRAPVRQPEALAWIQSQKGGEKVAQQQKKLATAQDRQQQALKQFNPLNPKFAKKGIGEGADFFAGSKFADEDGNTFSVEKIISFAKKNSKYFHKDFPLSKIKHDLSWWQGNKERMMNADTSFPLLVIQNDDGHLGVADGLNRMKKAVDVEKKTTIDVYLVPKKDIMKFSEKQDVAENFADGKNPQDKGDSKRHGVPTKASVSTLRKVAKQGGRKGQLAHWMANMKSGRSKKK